MPAAFPHSSTIPLSLPLHSLDPTSDYRAKHVKVYQVVGNEGENDDSDETGQNQQQQHKSKRLWGLVVFHNETRRKSLSKLVPLETVLFDIDEDDFVEKISGKHDDDIGKTLFPYWDPDKAAKFLDDKEAMFRSLVPQWLKAVSGLRKLCKWIKDRGLKCAAVTNAPRPNAELMISILGLTDFFHVLVIGSECDRAKPFPEPYLRALKELQASPEHKVVFEDSVKGIKAGVDNERMMHPRSLFKAFLDAVKTKRQSWSDHEMDAIHSLQLILRGTVDGIENKIKKLTIDSQMNGLKVDGILQLQIDTNEIVRLIETTNVPILAVGIDGLINDWNMKIAELTGLSVDEAIGRHLLTLAENSSADAMSKILLLASQGKEEQNVEFHLKTFGLRKDDGPIILVVNACASRDIQDIVIGKYHLTDKLSGVKRLRDALALGSQLQKCSVKRDACFVGSCFENFEILRGGA